MKSIQRKFNDVVKRNPYWSSYACFCETIRYKNYGKQTVARWFNKLVDIDDYDKKEKRDIIHFLQKLSMGPRTTKNKGNQPPQATIMDEQ
jgi:hypothetical protein